MASVGKQWRQHYACVTLVLFLGLAYLLRAESSSSSSFATQNSLEQQHAGHVQPQQPSGARLIDGVAATSGPPNKREDSSGGAVGSVQQQARTTVVSTSGRTHFADEARENVTVLVGQPAVLHCRVRNLGNRTVSWIRKRDLHILTSMAHTYTSDARFTVIYNAEAPDDWNLRIDLVQPRDEGIYECQVNTEPKIHLAHNLRVLDVKVEILGQEEVHVMKGSTISLTCTVNSQGVPPSNVTWYHAGTVIDFDGPRGGVSLETEKSKGGTVSKLMITRASLGDSGNYSCVSSKAARATAYVHVLNGEQPAAMQHGDAGTTASLGLLRSSGLSILLLTLLQLLLR